jgi:hypothetical protein
LLSDYFQTTLIPIYSFGEFANSLIGATPLTPLKKLIEDRVKIMTEKSFLIEKEWEEWKTKIPNKEELKKMMEQQKMDNEIRSEKDEKYGPINWTGHLQNNKNFCDFVDSLTINGFSAEVELCAIFMEEQNHDDLLFYRVVTKSFPRVIEKDFVDFLEQTLENEDFLAPNFGRVKFSEIVFFLNMRGNIKRMASLWTDFGCRKSFPFSSEERRNKKNWSNARFSLFIREK